MAIHLKHWKTISFAASLMATAMAWTPASAEAGRDGAAAARVITTARNGLAALEASAPGSTTMLRLVGWSMTRIPPRAAAPAIDTTTTGAVPPAIFKSAALPIRNLPAAAQWQRVYAQIGRDLGSDCASRDCRARASRLEAAVDHAKGARFVEKLRVVNLAVNRMIDYASDRQVHGRTDYWATPSQTLDAGRGDCEDYAILKMAALKAAGVPASSMTLVVLRDRERDLFHAVLAVATDKGHFILDNAHDAVLLDSAISRYQPLFSMSRDRYWLHGTKRAPGQLVASSQTSLRGIAPGEGPDALNATTPAPASLQPRD